ncbi:hypothetical protein [Pseudogemmobacter sonorensis]|uniref:hypothetical protein n=1 Tax=Pseudogemmobacter sonorensis TaxID=2989681 RepID=UPI00368F3D44
MAGFLGIRDSTVSQHLALLRRDRIISGRRDGQTIWYRIESKAAGQVGQPGRQEQGGQDDPHRREDACGRGARAQIKGPGPRRWSRRWPSPARPMRRRPPERPAGQDRPANV